MRTPLYAAACLAITLVVAGCTSTSGPDPALEAAASDALGAARTAELGLGLADHGRIFPTSRRAILTDAADQLADTAKELALQATSTKRDAAFRTRALDATRAALEAVHAADQGDSSAETALHSAAETLARLKDEG